MALPVTIRMPGGNGWTFSPLIWVVRRGVKHLAYKVVRAGVGAHCLVLVFLVDMEQCRSPIVGLVSLEWRGGARRLLLFFRRVEDVAEVGSAHDSVHVARDTSRLDNRVHTSLEDGTHHGNDPQSLVLLRVGSRGGSEHAHGGDDRKMEHHGRPAAVKDVKNREGRSGRVGVVSTVDSRPFGSCYKMLERISQNELALSMSLEGPSRLTQRPSSMQQRMKNRVKEAPQHPRNSP